VIGFAPDKSSNESVTSSALSISFTFVTECSIFLPVSELHARPRTITQVLQRSVNARATVVADVSNRVYEDTGNHEHFPTRPNLSAAFELDYYVFHAGIPRRRCCGTVHV
jgi:hypothetical protein